MEWDWNDGLLMAEGLLAVVSYETFYLCMVIVSLALTKTDIKCPQVYQMEEQVQWDLLPKFLNEHKYG